MLVVMILKEFTITVLLLEATKHFQLLLTGHRILTDTTQFWQKM